MALFILCQGNKRRISRTPRNAVPAPARLRLSPPLLAAPRVSQGKPARPRFRDKAEINPPSESSPHLLFFCATQCLDTGPGGLLGWISNADALSGSKSSPAWLSNACRARWRGHHFRPTACRRHRSDDFADARMALPEGFPPQATRCGPPETLGGEFASRARPCVRRLQVSLRACRGASCAGPGGLARARTIQSARHPETRA
jgi:hypothetical protein